MGKEREHIASGQGVCATKQPERVFAPVPGEEELGCGPRHLHRHRDIRFLLCDGLGEGSAQDRGRLRIQALHDLQGGFGRQVHCSKKVFKNEWSKRAKVTYFLCISV